MIEQTHSTKRIGMERSFKMIQPCSTQIFSCARKKGSIMCVWYCGEGFSKVFFNLKCIKMMFFHNVFYFWHNTSKPSKITYKNINLMFFQAKCIFKTHSNTVSNAIPSSHLLVSPKLILFILLPWIKLFLRLLANPGWNDNKTVRHLNFFQDSSSGEWNSKHHNSIWTNILSPYKSLGKTKS